VEPGVTGLQVPIGDPSALATAIASLADDAALRKRLGASARARATERFDLGVITERTRQLYRELLAHGEARGLALGRLA
jgi:glycosyltransferase involved in cell wall biosynthesis